MIAFDIIRKSSEIIKKNIKLIFNFNLILGSSHQFAIQPINIMKRNIVLMF